MITLYLRRRYHAAGTNGLLFFRGQQVCGTIELPWRNNLRMVSCIPEGRYRLFRHHFPKHGDQLGVANVPNREAILIHPGNDARKDLRGCIAPVTKHTEPGMGIHSRIAVDRIKALIYPVLEAGEEVWLIIVDDATLGNEEEWHGRVRQLANVDKQIPLKNAG